MKPRTAILAIILMAIAAILFSVLAMTARRNTLYARATADALYFVAATQIYAEMTTTPT